MHQQAGRGRQYQRHSAGNQQLSSGLVRFIGTADHRKMPAREQTRAFIHAVLVCASSSCPPIEIYTAESLEQDLLISGKAFVNGGGVVIDREANAVSLSRVFKWYGRISDGPWPTACGSLLPFCTIPGTGCSS